MLSFRVIPYPHHQDCFDRNDVAPSSLRAERGNLINSARLLRRCTGRINGESFSGREGNRKSIADDGCTRNGCPGNYISYV
jgi:hypothetical protein